MSVTLNLILHFPDETSRDAWIEKNREVLEAETAKYSQSEKADAGESGRSELILLIILLLVCVAGPLLMGFYLAGSFS